MGFAVTCGVCLAVPHDVCLFAVIRGVCLLTMRGRCDERDGEAAIM